MHLVLHQLEFCYIRGLRSKEKRFIVYSWIRKQKADICLLQETYLDKNLEAIVKREWDMETISSFGSNHSKGVTIAYKKSLDIKIENQTQGLKIRGNVAAPFPEKKLEVPEKN